MRAGDNIARLIFTKGRKGIADFLKHAATTASERHFSERNQQAAIGNIMHSVHLAVLNKAADEFCMRAFFGEIDRRRRAVFAAM